ncbi:hypothetical protein ACNKHO_09160 [Shigella flexneri]
MIIRGDATGNALAEQEIVAVSNMTVEATLTKLHYLLSLDLDSIPSVAPSSTCAASSRRTIRRSHEQTRPVTRRFAKKSRRRRARRRGRRQRRRRGKHVN